MTSFWKLPLWLVRLFVKPRKRKFSELDRKVWKHSWNFAPGRVKNISWQKSIGKRKKKVKKVIRKVEITKKYS